MPKSKIRQLKVAGVSFRPNYPDFLLDLNEDLLGDNPPEVVFEFCRERTNPYDVNAVKVMVNGTHVGYIPKNVAVAYASLMDGGRADELFVEEFSIDISGKHPDRPGMTLHINEPAEVEA